MVSVSTWCTGILGSKRFYAPRARSWLCLSSRSPCSQNLMFLHVCVPRIMCSTDLIHLRFCILSILFMFLCSHDFVFLWIPALHVSRVISYLGFNVPRALDFQILYYKRFCSTRAMSYCLPSKSLCYQNPVSTWGHHGLIV